MLPTFQRRRSVVRRARTGTGAGRRCLQAIGEQLESRRLLAIDVTNLNDTGDGSLRAAIDKVNSAGVADMIVFQNLTGTIFTKSALPTLAVTGTSFGSTGTSAVTLDGTLAGAGITGLTIGNNVNTIGLDGVALTIQNFSQNGISFLGGSTGSSIKGVNVRVNGQNGIQLAGGNYTNTIIKSSSISDNAKAGIATTAGVTGLTIGAAGLGNMIYGNDTHGIELAPGSYTGSSIVANVVSNNSHNGITSTGGVTGLTIGGTASGSANSVTVNGTNGLRFVAGDYTGSSVTGNSLILNGAAGISLAPAAGTLSNLVIGGTAAGTSNSIALNTTGGIIVNAGTYTGSSVVGNQIVSNKTAGMSLDPAGGVLSSLTIGGVAEGQDNSITSNTGPGILVAPGTYTSTTIVGNMISSNSSHGISLAAAGSPLTGLVIGGTANSIASNLGDGINVGPGTFTGTLIQDNTITGNTGAGIRLAPAGGSLTGLLVGGGKAATLGNRLSGNSSPGASGDAEIVAESGTLTGTKVQGNEITGAATGILLSGAQGITVGGETADHGNTVTGSSERGLMAMGTLTGAKAVHNTFTDNAAGVRLDGATGFALGETNAGNTIAGGTTGIVATGGLGGSTVRSNRVTGARVGVRIIDAQGTSADQPFTIGVSTPAAGSAGGNSVVATTTGLHGLGNLANTVVTGNIFKATAVNGNGAALSSATNLLLGGAAAGLGNVLTSAQGSAFYAKGVCTGSRVFRNNMTASRFGILLDNAKSLSVGSLPNPATTNIVQYNQIGLGTSGNTTGSGVMHTRWFRNVTTVVNPSGVAIAPTV
jgi:hypothetical protein